MSSSSTHEAHEAVQQYSNTATLMSLCKSLER